MRADGVEAEAASLSLPSLLVCFYAEAAVLVLDHVGSRLQSLQNVTQPVI